MALTIYQSKRGWTSHSMNTQVDAILSLIYK